MSQVPSPETQTPRLQEVADLCRSVYVGDRKCSPFMASCLQKQGALDGSFSVP